MVEPMLFIPFIENAFKHTTRKMENAIRICFTFERNKLTFMCENSYSASPTFSSTGGLGNELIRRRLSLLYPNQHQLIINTDNNIYSAILTLSYAN